MLRKLITSLCLVGLLASQADALSGPRRVLLASKTGNAFPIVGAILDEYFATGQYFPGPIASDLVDSRSTIKYVTDSSGLLHQIGIGALPISNAGLFYEPAAATNNVIQSGDLSNAAWSTSNIGSGSTTVTANAGLAPDGTTTAAKITVSRTVATDRAFRFQTVPTTAQTYAMSLYVMAYSAADVGKQIAFVIYNGTSNVANILVTLTTSYQRVGIVNGMPSSAGPNMSIGYNETAGTQTGTTNFLAAFAQWEPGTAVSSYYPTTTAAATRAADSIQIQRTGIGTLSLTYSDHSTQTLFLGPSNKYTLASLNQPLITRITGTATTAPLRQVASATNFPISTISAATVMSIQQVNSVYRGDSYQLVIPNVANESNTGGTLTCTAALQNGAGSTPFKFGGSASGSTAGNFLTTDELSVTVTSNTQALARIWCSSSNSTFAVMTGYSSGTGLYQGNTLSGAAVTDVTQATSQISSTTPGTFFGATVIAARHNSRAVAVYGDSINYGTGASGGVTGVTPIGGVIVPSIYTALPTANYGIPGDSLSTWVSGHTARIAVAPYFTSFVNEYGVNDITTQTAAQLEASLASMTSALAPFGPVISSTLPPSGSSSTDNYATTGNQTPCGCNGQKQLYNTFVRALTPHFFDVAGALEFSSGIWIVNGTATGSPWSDVHPTASPGYSSVISSGNVNPAWIQ